MKKVLDTLSLIFLAVVVSAVVAKSFAYVGRSADFTVATQQQDHLPRLNLRSAGITEDANRMRLVVAWSVDCVYCEKSAPFSRLLIAHAKSKGTKTFVIFPEGSNVLEARRKLSRNHLSGDDLLVKDLSALALRGTPTLYLADANGDIDGMWEGLQTRAKQREIFALVTGGEPFPEQELAQEEVVDQDRLIDAERLVPLVAGNLPDSYVVDVRQRDDFNRAHIKGSVNIPYDELEVRYSREIKRNAKVYLFCQFNSDCEFDAERYGETTMCSYVSKELELSGASKVTVIAETMDSIAEVQPNLLVSNWRIEKPTATSMRATK